MWKNKTNVGVVREVKRTLKMIIKKKKKKEDSKNKLFHFLVERIYIYIYIGRLLESDYT